MDNGEKGVLYLEEGELELLVNISPAGSHGSQAEAETASVFNGLVAAVLHLKIETESSIKKVPGTCRVSSRRSKPSVKKFISVACNM